MNSKRFWKKAGGYLLMLMICMVSILPFYALIVTAFNPADHSILNGDPFLPSLYLDNFAAAWETSHLGSALLNSVIITAGSLILLVFTAANAGYGISRFPTKWTKLVYVLFLLSMMIPPIVNTVPLYVLMQKINGVNTLWAMTLLCAANSLPLTTFLYTTFIRAIPREFEEAAIIDGCTWFSAFWRIIFPQLKPVTATAVIMNAVSIWNNYSQSVFFLQKRDVHTIPIAISIFFQTYGAKWNLMAAATIIGMIPALAVFLLFQKSFVKGITAGGIKG